MHYNAASTWMLWAFKSLREVDVEETQQQSIFIPTRDGSMDYLTRLLGKLRDGRVQRLGLVRDQFHIRTRQ